MRPTTADSFRAFIRLELLLYPGADPTFSDDEITTQMAFLNAEWGKFAPLTFTLVNTTWTQDEEKFLYVDDLQSDIRSELVSELHTGGALDINVYSLGASLLIDFQPY